MTMNRFYKLFLFVSILICLLSAISIADKPTSEATFLRHTEHGLMQHVEISEFQTDPSNNIDQTINWTYTLFDAIYRTAAIADHTHIFAGTYLNTPQEAELFEVEGISLPVWTYNGVDFYTDASDDSTTLAAINVYDTGLDVLKWTNPGFGNPDWTTSISGYSATSGGPIAVSDDGSTIAVVAAPSGTDAHLLLFDANSSTPLIDYVATGLGFPRYLKINADGRYPAFIASATLVVFDRNTLSVREQISMGASNSAMDISGDGDLIAYGWTNMQVLQWTGSSYQTLWTWDSGSYYVTRIAISADGSTIVSCWYTTSFNSVKVVVHDMSSSTPLWVHTYPTSSGTYQESVNDVDVSDDGSLIIVGSLGDAENLNPEVHVFQRDHEPHVIFTVDMPGSMHSVDISGDGNYATACGKHVHDNQMGRGGDMVSITLEGHNELSGALSGTIGPGFFNVVDYIYVGTDDTLQIMPATTFNFDGPYPFNIYGLLLAEGTESDSIFFTTDTIANPDRWSNICFYDAPDSSHLYYCGILHGRAFGNGGGIYCGNSNPIINHCYMRWNSAVSYGGAIYCENSNPAIINCTLIENGEWELGGGICCQDSSCPIIRSCTISESRMHGIYCGNQSNPTIEDCIITNNRSFGILCGNSSPTIADCNISDNWEMVGGGINCNTHSNAIISNCIISGNSSGPGGAGIVCEDYSDPIITNCTITENSGYEAGGILCSGNPTISHCVISQNQGGGAGICITGSSSAVIENCTITGNSTFITGGGISIQNGSPTITNTIVEGTVCGSGIWFYGTTNASIAYCDFNNNENGNFTGSVPDTLGEIVTTNLNDDSCDTYFNIFMDPLFEDPVTGDFHLQSTSPCIDAGDPTYPLDPDSTIADMGAFYYDHPPWVGDRSNQTHPSQFYLYPNYPNPFNPSTTITFDLNRTDHVTLKIYNTLGQEITTLVDANLTPGTYQVPFTATNLSSGIYFYTLTSSTHTQSRKMVMLK